MIMTFALIISAILGLVATVASTAMAKDSAEQAQENEFSQQEKMLGLQNQFTEDMWERNNEYNNPVEQMTRGIEAGINPNALAQGISGAPTFGQQVQSTQTPSVNPLGGVLGSIMSNFGSSINGSLNHGLDSMMQLRKQQSEIDVNEALENLYNKQGGKTEADTIYQEIINKWADQHQQWIVYKAEHDAHVSEENAKIYKADAAIRENLNALKLSELQSTIDNLDQQFNNLVQDFRLKIAEHDKIVQETRESAARTEYDKASTEESRARKSFIIEQENTERQKQFNLQMDAWWQQMQNEIFSATGVDPSKEPIFARYQKILVGDLQDPHNNDVDQINKRVEDASKFLNDMKEFKIITETLVNNREYSKGFSGDLIKFVYQYFRTVGRGFGDEKLFGEAGN